MTTVDLRVSGILDLDVLMGGSEAEHALAAARGGCTLIAVRGHSSNARLLAESVRRILAAVDGTGVPVLVQGRADVALAAGAHGVHLGQQDLHASDARRLLGPDRIVSTTIETPAQADELYRLPVDCCWIGPVYPDPGEPPSETLVGLNGLSRIAFRARLATGGLPVGASGGIEPSRAGALIGAGADGVAVPLAAPDAAATAQLAGAVRRLVDSALQSRAMAQP